MLISFTGTDLVTTSNYVYSPCWTGYRPVPTLSVLQEGRGMDWKAKNKTTNQTHSFSTESLRSTALPWSFQLEKHRLLPSTLRQALRDPRPRETLLLPVAFTVCVRLHPGLRRFRWILILVLSLARGTCHQVQSTQALWRGTVWEPSSERKTRWETCSPLSAL